MDVARTVREHLGRPHAPEKLRLGVVAKQGVVDDVLGGPVQAEALALFEVDEEQPDVRVDEGVPGGQVHPVAVVVREGDRVLVHDVREARVATLVRALGPTVCIRCGDEEHVAALDEGPVVVVDPVPHEPLVDPVRKPAGVEAILVAATAVVEQAHLGSSSRWVSQTSWKPRRFRIGYEVPGTACVTSAGVPRSTAWSQRLRTSAR